MLVVNIYKHGTLSSRVGFRSLAEAHTFADEGNHSALSGNRPWVYMVDYYDGQLLPSPPSG